MSSRALTELLRGSGAHADPVAWIEDLSDELASRQVEGSPHTIAALVHHMNYWMDYDLRRARGEKPPYPEHNAKSFPQNSTVDARAWEQLRREFASLLNDAAKMASEDDLERRVEATHPSHEQRASTLEAVLWQLVAHNSYHLGQIVMIRQALGAWPPQGGGDTW